MREATKAAAPVEPSIFAPLAGRKAERVSWLVPGRFPAASLSLVEGRKGLGKSTILAALCAQTTGGPTFPGVKKKTPTSVIWLGAEEDTATMILPRLKAAGTDMKRVFSPAADKETGRAPRLHFPTDLEILETAIDRHGVRVVVLDPWQSYADLTLDLHQEQHARSVLEPLADLAARSGCAIVMARHLRKGTFGPALDQGMGSVAIGNVCRAVSRVDKHPTLPDLRTLSVVACNLAERAPTLTYRIASAPGGGGRIDWVGTSGLDADSLAEAAGDEGFRDARGDALRLLRSAIKDRWVRTNEIMTEAKLAGVSDGTLRRAKAELGVQARRRSSGGVGYWEWGPPEGGWPPDM